MKIESARKYATVLMVTAWALCFTAITGAVVYLMVVGKDPDTKLYMAILTAFISSVQSIIGFYFLAKKRNGEDAPPV